MLTRPIILRLLLVASLAVNFLMLTGCAVVRDCTINACRGFH